MTIKEFMCTLHREVIKPFFGWCGLGKLLERNPKVAVIALRGVIGGQSGMRSGQHLNFDDLEEVIDKAFAMSRVKAVALEINSPGGSPVQSARIQGYISQLSLEKDIPVYAFCEDVAASGGYWLACAADEIYADPSSIVGSIGVISSGFGFHELIAKHGIERRVYAQGENKSMLDPFQPEKKSDIDKLLDAQKDVHEAFKDFVKSRRGERLDSKSRLLFTGAFFSGKKAMELGLVDGLGHVQPIMKQKFGDKVKCVRLQAHKGWLSRTLNLFSAPRLVAEVVATLEERAYFARFGR